VSYQGWGPDRTRASRRVSDTEEIARLSVVERRQVLMNGYALRPLMVYWR
jgi:hypothetical protein